MKVVRQILFVLLFAVLAALGVIFWPKIRECCDRWLASGRTEENAGDNTVEEGP